MKNNPHAEHRIRLKARFKKGGIDGFAHHEVIELMLYFGIVQKDTNILAHELMNRFGSFFKVFDAPYEELLKVNGIGDHTAILIKLFPAVARVYFDDLYDGGVVLDTTEKTVDFLKSKYIGRTTEVVYLICLDSKKKLLYADIIFEGTINASSITVRKVMEVALRVSATAVVISHNHPNGFSMPSTDDINATHVLKKALQVVAIDLLDHIIVSHNDYTSLAKCGVMYSN